MYPAGSSSVVEIKGRELSQLVAQVNKYCGTKRTVSGKLSKSAGLVADLQSVVKQFVNSPPQKQQEIIDMLQTPEKSTAPNASYKIYAQCMEKIASGETGFVDKEIQRLTSLINDSAVDPLKADELSVRRNILAVFAEAIGVKVANLENDDLLAAENELHIEAEEAVSEEIKEF